MLTKWCPVCTHTEELNMQTTEQPGEARPTASQRSERRQWLVRAGAAALALGNPWPSAWAQPASAAAEEARAPALPALGSVLVVPPIRLLDGALFDAAQHAGQPLLVYWWSSTCPFCALQSPSMEKLWQSQGGKGMQMLALSIDRQPEAASVYLNQKGYSFPAAWASPVWRKTFPKPRGLPITLLRGADGRLLLAERGQMFAEDVEAIAALL
jgi:thiol-disulfide isomerase/thioredoxin